MNVHQILESVNEFNQHDFQNKIKFKVKKEKEPFFTDVVKEVNGVKPNNNFVSIGTVINKKPSITKTPSFFTNRLVSNLHAVENVENVAIIPTNEIDKHAYILGLSRKALENMPENSYFGYRLGPYFNDIDTGYLIDFTRRIFWEIKKSDFKANTIKVNFRDRKSFDTLEQVTRESIKEIWCNKDNYKPIMSTSVIIEGADIEPMTGSLHSNELARLNNVITKDDILKFVEYLGLPETRDKLAEIFNKNNANEGALANESISFTSEESLIIDKYYNHRMNLDTIPFNLEKKETSGHIPEDVNTLIDRSTKIVRYIGTLLTKMIDFCKENEHGEGEDIPQIIQHKNTIQQMFIDNIVNKEVEADGHKCGFTLVNSIETLNDKIQQLKQIVQEKEDEEYEGTIVAYEALMKCCYLKIMEECKKILEYISNAKITMKRGVSGKKEVTLTSRIPKLKGIKINTVSTTLLSGLNHNAQCELCKSSENETPENETPENETPEASETPETPESTETPEI